MKTLSLSVVGLVLSSFCLIACGASMRSATAHEIGCSDHDTMVFDPEEKNGNETWIARCQGNRREYSCTRAGDSDQVSCEPVKADESGVSRQ